MTIPTFTSAIASAPILDSQRIDDPTFEPSLLTFETDSFREIVKVTVTHARLRNADEREAIDQGWPTVLSNLKALLETGDVLPHAPWEFHGEDCAARMAKNE